MSVQYTEVRCKFCNSNDVIRYGHFKNMQRWWCKACHRKFADNNALPGMKTPSEQVSSALGMYYEGMSLNAIRRQLDQTYHNNPSDSTVYEWIDDFTQKAIDEADNYHPKVGDTWVADETVLRIGGKKLWLIDIIDTDTRFLLATKLSTNRNTNDIKILMERARERAGRVPKKVLTDGWKGYLDGIELAYGADSKHIVTDPFAGKDNDNTELIERWHGTLKDRTKVMRGLKEKETADQILNGWLIHYNYFRPHESLNGKTPAQASGLKFIYTNWADVINSEKPDAQKEISKYPHVHFVVTNEPIRQQRNVRIREVTPRIFGRMLRISEPRMPKGGLPRGDVYARGGMYSRHPFRGSHRVIDLGGGIIRSDRRQHLRLD